LADKAAAEYVWGIGIHWYSTEITKYEPIMRTHKLLPEHAIFATEACAGRIYFTLSPRLTERSGEKYESSALGNISANKIDFLRLYLATLEDWGTGEP